jgi:lipoprotein-releasing system permease protein
MNNMFQPLALFVGLRYTRARSNKHFISFISLASMIGIAIGVIVLITALSVMNGFEVALRERILSVMAHVTVSETDAQLSNWQPLANKIKNFPHVKYMSTFVEKPVMLSFGDEARGVMLEGVIPEEEATVSSVFSKNIPVKGNMFDLKPGSMNIALGETLAKELKVTIGDSLLLVSPSNDALETGELPALQQFNVVATFRVDMQNYDAAFAYINREDAQTVFKMGQDITGLRIKLDDMNYAPKVSEDIFKRLSTEDQYPDIWVSDWTHQNENLFKAIQMQKTMMFFVLILIIAVAAFNLVSTLVMVVTDKEADIAILRTQGLSSGGIMKIFMVQGTLIGVIGTLVGVILGILLASNLDVIVPLLESLFDTHFINAKVYGVNELQSKVNFADVSVIAAASLIMSMLATLYPAWRASKVQPAEALRYE